MGVTTIPNMSDGTSVSSRYIALLEKSVTDTLHKDYDGNVRENASSMMPPVNMHALTRLCILALINHVEGDFCECGVWRGGAGIVMKGVLAAMGDTTRRVYVCDSFHGMPPNQEQHDAAAAIQWQSMEWLKVDLDTVRDNFRKYDLLDERVVFVEGFFEESLPGPIEKLAILRSDCDMYSGTQAILRNLYPRLSVGGYFLEDDYNNPGLAHIVQPAINDYRKEHGITDPIIPIPGGEPADTNLGIGIWWRKTGTPDLSKVEK